MELLELLDSYWLDNCRKATDGERLLWSEEVLFLNGKVLGTNYRLKKSIWMSYNKPISGNTKILILFSAVWDHRLSMEMRPLLKLIRHIHYGSLILLRQMESNIIVL